MKTFWEKECQYKQDKIKKSRIYNNKQYRIHTTQKKRVYAFDYMNKK